MRTKKFINLMLITLCTFFIIGVGAFVYYAKNTYKISSDFVSVPLEFNYDDSSSTYKMSDAQVTIYGGFVKGIKNGKDNTKSLVIRALSPLPTLKIEGTKSANVSLLIENVNPDFYAGSIKGSKLHMTKVTDNTLQLDIPINPGKPIKIEPIKQNTPNNVNKYQYVVLGDNRNGYDTFQKIIEQVNGEEPVFVIDNGDLVFSGKPNQYRLFDQMISKVSTTLCTVPGNHDIRNNGYSTYTMLYGPSHYSFDFADSHFVFLDSSPGWAEKRAISNEQYIWLEKDLKKAQGKRIFVITHIPPEDPRKEVKTNKIPNYASKVESGNSWVEQKLNNYNETKEMNHGFQDPKEAEKFENIMSTYHVDTVYLSHIHSYFDYTKNGVRYIITGGAGAELLTKNSYYHYIIEKIDNSKSVTRVELPSPANTYVTRYLATVQLFANSMYEENPAAVVFILLGFSLLIILLIIKIYLRKKRSINTVGKWLIDTFRYARNHFKELFKEKHNN